MKMRFSQLLGVLAVGLIATAMTDSHMSGDEVEGSGEMTKPGKGRGGKKGGGGGVKGTKGEKPAPKTKEEKQAIYCAKKMVENMKCIKDGETYRSRTADDAEFVKAAKGEGKGAGKGKGKGAGKDKGADCATGMRESRTCIKDGETYRSRTADDAAFDECTRDNVVRENKKCIKDGETYRSRTADDAAFDLKAAQTAIKCAREMVENPKCIKDGETYRSRTTDDATFVEPDCSAGDWTPPVEESESGMASTETNRRLVDEEDSAPSEAPTEEPMMEASKGIGGGKKGKKGKKASEASDAEEASENPMKNKGGGGGRKGPKAEIGGEEEGEEGGDMSGADATSGPKGKNGKGKNGKGKTGEGKKGPASAVDGWNKEVAKAFRIACKEVATGCEPGRGETAGKCVYKAGKVKKGKKVKKGPEV